MWQLSPSTCRPSSNTSCRPCSPASCARPRLAWSCPLSARPPVLDCSLPWAGRGLTSGLRSTANGRRPPPTSAARQRSASSAFISPRRTTSTNRWWQPVPPPEAGLRPRADSSADAAGAELDADARADAAGGLGDRVFPGALARAAHHDEIAMAERVSDRRTHGTTRPTRSRPQGQYASITDGQDGDHRVLVVPAPDPVTMPGHAVPTVAVEAQSRRTERLTQLVRVALAEEVAGLVEDRQRQFLVLPVEAEQPRHVDHPVVHLPALRLPRDIAREPFVHLIRPGQPPRQYVDPRTTTEVRPPNRGQRTQRGILERIQQRALKISTHATTLPEIRTFVPLDSDGAPHSARMARLLIRNVSVLIVPGSGDCRVDQAQDIRIHDGQITAITPSGQPPATDTQAGD